MIRNGLNGRHRPTGDGERTPPGPRFTPEQLAELRAAEAAIREFADEYGVQVDYTTHPIDPAAALELNEAITRMAHEYPGAFRRTGRIRTPDTAGLIEYGARPEATLGITAGPSERPVGRDPIPPGIYLNRTFFADKAAPDLRAARSRQINWSVSGTAGEPSTMSSGTSSKSSSAGTRSSATSSPASSGGRA